MNAPKPHPAIAVTEGLTELRGLIAANDIAGRFAGHCAVNLLLSRSQLFQDLFVLFFSNSKRNGFFVEFGATDGIDLSNSFILERQFGWTGILAEPAQCWHQVLKANRKAAIDFRCVWSESGQKLEFKETALPELSTVIDLTEKDFNRNARKVGRTYQVETVSLNDLLQFHKCPKVIDYLSVDTEGSEYAILSKFDFSRYDIKIITVEHNFIEPDRGNIHALLSANGFVRVFEPLSRWDDWYLHRSIAGAAATAF